MVLQFSKKQEIPKDEPVKPLEYGYHVRIQYDPTFDHFQLSSSFKSAPNTMVIDGAQAQYRLEEFLKVFFHEVEDYKRAIRKNK